MVKIPIQKRMYSMLDKQQARWFDSRCQCIFQLN
jgi:hypothetical protein